MSFNGGHGLLGMVSKRLYCTLDFSKFKTNGTSTAGLLVSTGTTWLDFATAGQCGMKLLLSYSATSGEFATLRMRARADAAGSVICGNFSASAGANNHGNLYAVQAYAQPNAYTNNSASNIICALYGCIDAGGSDSGRRWCLWVDTHETTKSGAGDYLARFSHNGTIAIDGCFTFYIGGRMPYIFNFEDASGFLTDSIVSLTTNAGALAVKTPAGVKYIALLTA